VLQSSCPSGNEEPRPEPLDPDPDHPPEDDGAADHEADELEAASKNWSAVTLELTAAEDQVELEVEAVEDADVEVEADVHVEVGVVENDEQAFAGATPSAHFNSPSSIPVHASSGEMRLPLSS
jgi:hypothetical protein